MDYGDEFDHDFDESAPAANISIAAFPTPTAGAAPLGSPLFASPPAAGGGSLAPAFGSHPLLSPSTPVASQAEDTDRSFSAPVTETSYSSAPAAPRETPQKVAASPADDDYGADFDEFSGSPGGNSSFTTAIDASTEAHSQLPVPTNVEASESIAFGLESSQVGPGVSASHLDERFSIMGANDNALREFSVPNPGNSLDPVPRQHRKSTMSDSLPGSRSRTPSYVPTPAAPVAAAVAPATSSSSATSALTATVSPGVAFRQKVESYFTNSEPLPFGSSPLDVIKSAAADEKGPRNGGRESSRQSAKSSTVQAVAQVPVSKVKVPPRVIVVPRERPAAPQSSAAPPIPREAAGSAASAVVASKRLAAARAELAEESEKRIAEVRDKANASISSRDKMIKSLTRRLEALTRSAEVDAGKVREYDVLANRVVILEAERCVPQSARHFFG